MHTLDHSGIVVAPLIVYPILANTVDKNLNDNGLDDSFDNGFDDNTGDFEKKLWEARGISFGIFFGMGLFFWTPMIIWKSIVSSPTTTLTRYSTNTSFSGSQADEHAAP